METILGKWIELEEMMKISMEVNDRFLEKEASKWRSGESR